MVVTILYFINLALAFFALVEGTALLALDRKTAYAYVAGRTSVFVFAFGLVAFFVQLVMYPYAHKYTVHAVYAALAILFAGYIACAVYCFMLGRRSNKGLCIVTGIMQLLPPVGAIFVAILCKKLRRDTRAQELVFTGYSYTLAAFAEFSSKYAPDFVDAASAEEFAPLSEKGIKAHLKKLKKQAKTPEGCFKYGEAVAHYTPHNMHEAVSYITRSAKGNYPSALFNLGYFYECGIYVKPDLKKAREFYKRASDLGDGDAGLRLAITDVLTGKQSSGIAEIARRAQTDDIAKYDHALCIERGLGEQRDVLRAVGMYAECAKNGLLVAQRRLFAMLADGITSGKTDDGVFGKIVSAGFTGEFGLMVSGAESVASKHAAEAADIFLCAVKKRGKWEGEARMFVGTLYSDCGKLDVDRKNGAAYVKSALPLTPVANRVYAIIPKSVK